MKSIIKRTLGILARIVSGLLPVCVILGAWAGWINPNTWAIPAVLCLTFPFLWFVTLIVTLLWAVFSKEKVTATVCGTCLLVTLPQLLNVSPVSFPSKPKDDEKTFKLLTYNMANAVNMDSINPGYSRSVSYVINSDADIVCLQEYFDIKHLRQQSSQITYAQTDSLNKIYPYQIYWENLESRILSKYPIEYVTSTSRRTKRYFNFIIGRIDIDGYSVHIMDVHLSSYNLDKEESRIAANIKETPEELLNEEQNRSLYRKLRSAFSTRAGVAEEVAQIADSIPGPLIVCGDFNDVPNSYAWRTIKDAGLDDAYTSAGFGPMITFNANHFLFHIDQIMYRPDVGMRPYDIKRGYIRSSDHYPVIADFAISNSGDSK